MSKIEKLILKFSLKPKTFKWKDLETLLNGLGFEKLEGSGSRVKFIHKKGLQILSLHKPHPLPDLKSYQIRQIYNSLKEWGLI